MSIQSWLRRWSSPILYLSNNWISLLGVLLVTTATVFWFFFVTATWSDQVANPYLGIVGFFVLPAAFFLGLALIPLGIFLRYRRERRSGEYPQTFSGFSWTNPAFRRLAAFVAVATVVNLIIGAQFAYSTVHYMDSVTFCGLTCHTVMKPEFTAYQNSPHSRVSCVQCHIGPGASWFVRSKLSGTRQVFAAWLETYPRPIPTPIEDLRPARDTCEGCHWPEKFVGQLLRIIPHYADDAENTRSVSVLLMHIGGGPTGPYTHRGIHGAHLGPGVSIRYAYRDEDREQIPTVYYQNTATGREVLYRTPGTADESASLPTRLMDCIDCHNRPSHTFHPPDKAVNAAIAAGEISPDLPFAKKLSVELITKEYPTQEQALPAIREQFARHYQKQYPDIFARSRDKVLSSADGVAGVYSRNVFPVMNVSWGTYPNHIGHESSPGCFRCHDGEHVSAAGDSIGQDCSACHEMLAIEESSPAILKQLGIPEVAAEPVP